LVGLFIIEGLGGLWELWELWEEWENNKRFWKSRNLFSKRFLAAGGISGDAFI